MRKYILSIFTLILILTTVSAQEQTVTATNDTTPALTKRNCANKGSPQKFPL